MCMQNIFFCVQNISSRVQNRETNAVKFKHESQAATNTQINCISTQFRPLNLLDTSDVRSLRRLWSTSLSHTLVVSGSFPGFCGVPIMFTWGFQAAVSLPEFPDVFLWVLLTPALRHFTAATATKLRFTFYFHCLSVSVHPSINVSSSGDRSTEVKVAITKCRNNPLQVNILHSKSHFQFNTIMKITGL